jgi:hypothetical protein
LPLHTMSPMGFLSPGYTALRQGSAARLRFDLWTVHGAEIRIISREARIELVLTHYTCHISAFLRCSSGAAALGITRLKDPMLACPSVVTTFSPARSKEVPVLVHPHRFPVSGPGAADNPSRATLQALLYSPHCRTDHHPLMAPGIHSPPGDGRSCHVTVIAACRCGLTPTSKPVHRGP